jgi:hypothetical protein
MIKMKTYVISLVVILSFLTNGCVEEIDVETLTFERVLVVEAVITNELKYQEITLSRSFKFEDNGAAPETNASVSIVDNLQNSYNFYEIFPGKYKSSQEFQAQPTIEYQLIINTIDGKTYNSKTTQLTQVTPISDVYAERTTDSFNNDGMAIYVDAFDPTGNSKYYRYEYEETYEVVAPYWVPNDLVILSYTPPFRYTFEPKTTEQLTCYNTVFSNEIIQKETNDLAEDRVSKFRVRFIPQTDPVISHRYSILVKQYVQSIDAFTYYKTLNKLSGSGNVFSQNQPGYFAGNIVSVTDSNEKVLGFFEVSSVSSERIFFNYYDFYNDEPLPPYFVECTLGSPFHGSFPGDTSLPPLLQLIDEEKVKYYRPNPNWPNPLNEVEGRYLVVPIECGDCTKLGSNIKPDFWE